MYISDSLLLCVLHGLMIRLSYVGKTPSSHTSFLAKVMQQCGKKDFI